MYEAVIKMQSDGNMQDELFYFLAQLCGNISPKL